MDWNRALKVGGPSVIITYVFYNLINNYLAGSQLLQNNLLQNNLLLNIVFLAIVFLFCVFVCYRVTMPKNDSSNKLQIIDNEIEENEVESSLNIGKKYKEADIKKNKINKNKVKGDLNIG